MSEHHEKNNNSQENVKKTKKDKIVTAVIILLTVFIIGYNLFSYYAPNIMLPGKTFDKVSGVDPFNGRNTTINFPDGKVIVNVWATWCGSCVKELHVFDKFSSKTKVVGVLKKPYDVRGFSRSRVRYRNVVADDRFFDDFYISTLPTTILVKDGAIDKVYVGPVTEKILSDWLASNE